MNGLTRKLAIGLSISVALNLFLLGFGIARMLGRSHRDHRGPGGRGADMHAEWQPHRERLRPLRQEVRQARRAVRRELTADPFDRAALEQALTDLRASTGRGQAAFHAALVDMASGMDVQQRKRLAHDRQLWRGDGGPRRRHR